MAGSVDKDGRVSVGDILAIKVGGGEEIYATVFAAAPHQICIKNSNGSTWRMSPTMWKEPKAKFGRIGSFTEWIVRAKSVNEDNTPDPS